jgi:thioredoxin 1
MIGCGCRNFDENAWWFYAALAMTVIWTTRKSLLLGRRYFMEASTKETGLAVKGIIVFGLVILVGLAVYARRGTGSDQTASQSAASPSSSSVPNQAARPLPRLVDLGAGKCIPCKMMAPILEELKTEYVGRMNVQFIDVWENPAAGQPFGIRVIPTQIFYDATGKELFRHEGFFAKEDILGKWKELGVALER